MSSDPIGTATQWAGLAKQIGPTFSMPSWEQQFIQDELMAGHEQNAGGLFSGFKLPPNVNIGDFMQMTSLAEQYGNAIGWQHFPTPQQVMQAVNQGITNLNDAARLWGKNLPERLGYVKHGMTAQAFADYREKNRQAIINRFGSHAADNDAFYVRNLDHEQQQFQSSGGAVGGLKAQVSPQNQPAVR